MEDIREYSSREKTIEAHGDDRGGKNTQKSEE